MSDRCPTPESLSHGELAAVLVPIAAEADDVAAPYIEEAARRLSASEPRPAPERALLSVLRGLARVRGDA